jgi:hypothetical protein
MMVMPLTSLLLDSVVVLENLFIAFSAQVLYKYTRHVLHDGRNLTDTI